MKFFHQPKSKLFMVSTLLKTCGVTFVFATTGFSQNLIPTNPGAEAGTFSGWTVTATSFGANQPSDPLNSATINQNPNFLTEGTHSFFLQDGSANTSLRLTSTPDNRAMISINTDYQLSFDAKIIGTPGYPLFQIHYYTDPAGTNPPGQLAYDLSNPGSFSASHPAANGFTEYVINLRF